MRRRFAPVAGHKKLAVLAAVVLVAGGAGLYLVLRNTGSSKAATANYQLVAATTGVVRESVATTGTVAPADQASLSFAASGTVTSVRVAQGDTVKAGQVLATIDSAALKASLAQAQASLAQAQAKVASDNASGITGTQLSADEAAVTAAQGSVTAAQTALDGASLTSPIAGTVASVSISDGDNVSGSGSGGSNRNGAAASSSTSSGTPDLLVIGTAKWLVNATVDDTEVGLVKTGMQAQVSIGTGTTLLYGTVSSVGVVADSSSGTPVYPVVVELTGSPSGVHSGASATVALVYKQVSNALTVPTLAVHLVNGTSVVYEMSGGKQVAHTVTTGLSSGGETQILTGLSEGDQVVVTLARGTGSSSNSTRTRFGGGFGGGGFGGGGFGPPGGFGGGGFTGGGRVGTGGN